MFESVQMDVSRLMLWTKFEKELHEWEGQSAATAFDVVFEPVSASNKVTKSEPTYVHISHAISTFRPTLMASPMRERVSVWHCQDASGPSCLMCMCRVLCL